MKKRMALICAAMITVLLFQFAAGLFATSLVESEAFICVGFTLAALLIVKGSQRLSVTRDTTGARVSKKGNVRAVLLLTPLMLASCYFVNVITYLIFKSNAGTLDLSSPVEATVIAVIVAPIFEEIFIRRAVISVLKPLGNIFAVIVSAVCFSLMHVNLTQLPYTFVAGLFLGAAAVYTGSILPSIIIHACNNAVSVIMSVIMSLISLNCSQKAVVLATRIFVAVLLILCAVCVVYIGNKQFKRTAGARDETALPLLREATLGKNLMAALLSPLLIYVILTLTIAILTLIL